MRKTGKALVVYEDAFSWGSGAENAARIGDELFDDLDGPVRRLASTDSFVAYRLEHIFRLGKNVVFELGAIGDKAVG
ncbi:MAG: transketolase C-terminal domain-containing protein [Myxococcota bacterium]